MSQKHADLSSKHLSAVHQKQHICQVEGCVYLAGYRADLHRHNKDKHLKKKDLMCLAPGCARLFSRKDNLRRHVKSVHGGGIRSMLGSAEEGR